MKKLSITLGIALFAIVGLFIRCSEETEVSPRTAYPSNLDRFTIESKNNYKPASTEREFFLLMADSKVNMIRSKSDYLVKTKQRGSVYAKLDSKSQKVFRESLKFKNGGLSTARIDIIKKAFPDQREYAAFWGGFGLDPVFVADHIGYKCESVGNCKDDTSYICTSNC